jgi:transketolase
MEGVNHEAAGLAGHLKLGRLIVLWDDNRITIDGSTALSRNEDVMARYAATAWHTVECDGLDSASVSRALDSALADARPSLIRCKTIIGYGAPNKQGTEATTAPRSERTKSRPPGRSWGGTRRRSKCPKTCFPPGAGRRARRIDHREWQRRLSESGRRDEFYARLSGKADDGWLQPYLDELVANPPKVATRKASEMALEKINPIVESTIGGSADLTGSNNTKTKALEALTPRITAAATSITVSASSEWQRR